MTKQQPFWLSQALANEVHQDAIPLQGDISAEVCIVGGGYTGLWTALHLKKANPQLDIAIIDKGLCGSGASGRNGGCMLTWSGKYLSLKRLYGEEEALRLVRASEAAVYQIRDFCQQENIDAQIRLDGALYTATNEAQLGSMNPVLEELTRLGVNNWETCSTEDLLHKSGSARHIEGIYSPVAGSLQPGMLVRGLRQAALRRGVKIYENTPMLSLIKGQPAQVITPTGNVTAGKIVMAVNSWMPELFSQFSRSIVLVSSDMLITEPAPELLARSGLTDGKAVLDSRTFVHYYRSTPDGRLMLGKGGNMFAFNNRVIPAFDQASRYRKQLQDALGGFFPLLSDTKIEQTWTGPSDRSVTGFPFFGNLGGESNLFYGLGYSGNGVVQCHLGGEILASMAFGLDNEWTRSPLTKGPLGQFPPEPFRWIGAMTVRNAIRRKEDAEDAAVSPWWIDKQLAKLGNAAGKSDKT